MIALNDVPTDQSHRAGWHAPLALDATGPLKLSAWRGRSGRRYVVSVYPLDLEADAAAGALLLAVERDRVGSRRLIAACESGALGFTGVNGAWIAAMRRRGANELHVHLLAATRDSRRATLADLGE